MANTNAPFGFRQAKGTGSVPTYEQVALPNGGIAYNNATPIYFGDPIERTNSASSTLVQSATGSTNALAGIFTGCSYMSTAQKRRVWSNYWPGSDVAAANNTATVAYYVNDPNAQFIVQSDSTGVAQANIGANVSFNIGSGNASNGLSGAYITPGSTLNATATTAFRITGLVQDPPGSNGTAAGAYNWAMVAFNNVETRTLTPFNS